MNDEHVYRYPRRITWPIELIGGLLVLWSTVRVARVALALLWNTWPLEPFILHRVPGLAELVSWVALTGPDQLNLQTFTMPLLWMLVTLFVVLILRNMFPPVRYSARGLLVGFEGDWVPVRWEGLRALRVTDTPDNKRFVVLAQAAGQDLTSWHRIYALLYHFRFRRGFLISSAIQDGEGLLRDIMNEIDRRSRLGEKLNIEMSEGPASPLFGMLLNLPGLLRGARNQSEAPVFQPVATAATMGSGAALTMPSIGGVIASAPQAAPAQPQVAPAQPQALAPAAQRQPTLAADAIQGGYSRGIQGVLNVLTVLILGFALWRYLAAWSMFLLFTFPSLRDTAIFRGVTVVPLVSHWGLLVGAHVALLLVVAIVLMLRHLFPAVALDSNGIVFSALGRSHWLAWEHVSFVKATDIRDEQHVILVEAEGRHLPWYYVMGSWLYDGGSGRGALIWPMLSQFEPLMQRMALELTRRQAPDQPMKLRDDAPGWLLMLAVRPAEALDRLVGVYERERDLPQDLELPAVLRAGLQMLWVTAAPAILLLLYWMMYKGQLLVLQVPLMLILAIIWGITEWPLASFLSSSIDQIVGVGNKGYQGLYLYPTAQLPRVLPLVLAVLLTLMGFPTLAMIAWGAGIAWSGLLTAGLWEALYGWRGPVLLAGSIMTVFFQILTLIGVLVLRG